MGNFRNNNNKYPIKKMDFFLKLKLWVCSKTATTRTRTRTMSGVRIIRYG